MRGEGIVRTFVERIRGHGGVRVAEGNRVDRVRDVERGRRHRVKLVDVSAVADHALAMRDVEVAGDLVDLHHPANHAALVAAHRGEVTRPIADTLCGVPQDVDNAPLLVLIHFDQIITRVAAPDNQRALRV